VREIHAEQTEHHSDRRYEYHPPGRRRSRRAFAGPIGSHVPDVCTSGADGRVWLCLFLCSGDRPPVRQCCTAAVRAGLAETLETPRAAFRAWRAWCRAGRSA
jgi:hypothetical protein